MKLKKLTSYLSTSLTLLLIVFSDVVLARAGGGGGSSFGGGSSYHSSYGSSGGGGGDSFPIFVIVILVLAVLLICSWVHAWNMSCAVRDKNEECRSLISKIAVLDSCWDLNAMKVRIEDVYFKVQEAWTKGDQQIAKDYVSQRLFDKHQRQLEEMHAKMRKNILENVQLHNTKIVQVRDSEDDSKDQFWALIEGSMNDFTINTVSGDAVNDENNHDSFKELWLFIRKGQAWVLDEIVSDVSIEKLSLFTSQSDAQICNS